MREPDLRTRRIPLGTTGRWLHVMEAGLSDREAPTMLLVHGAAGCWHNFYPQIRTFSQNYRVIAPDLRGHGLSPWPGPSRIEDFLDDLDRLVDAEIPRSFELIGHSFGGALSTHLAVRRQSHINHLALLNTGGNIPRGFVYRLLQLFCSRVQPWRKFQPYSVGCTSEVAQQLLHKTLKGWDCWDHYRQITVPTLCVFGKLDALIPAAFAPRMEAALPNSTVHVIPSGGHVSMWESPRILRGLLRELLGRNSAQALAV